MDLRTSAADSTVSWDRTTRVRFDALEISCVASSRTVPPELIKVKPLTQYAR